MRGLRPSLPIETERLSLRAFERSDLDWLARLQADPQVTRYLYWGPNDAEASRASLERKLDGAAVTEPGGALSLAAALRETGELVGDCTLFWLSEEHRQGEIGFVFDPRHHGRGYAGEASTQLLRLGFEGLDLHRMIGRLDARNLASARLLERLGMRREAHLVENEIVKGEWTDELVYAILRREWESGPGGG